MRTLQDYLEIYRTIAINQGLAGAGVEMIAQMLANASYINEVENVSMVRESSIEMASLVNSKIQHCMNEMYSVFRGSCPRVIIKFKSNKYLNFNVFDNICTANSFSVYYLGYLNTNMAEYYGDTVPGSDTINSVDNFIYAPTIIPPTGDKETDPSYTIIGLVAKDFVTQRQKLSVNNTYYITVNENNLSNDLYVKINGDYFDVTRTFSDHINTGKIFDLTIPSFGMRLYTPDIFRNKFERAEVITPTNTEVEVGVFKYCTLDSFNTSELKSIKIKGTKLVDFDASWVSENGLTLQYPGLIYLNEIPRNDLNTIHYKAVRDRYVNSILRSNSDIGVILEELFPDKVMKNGTNYKFVRDSQGVMHLNVYYIPFSNETILTEEEKSEYIKKRRAYYVSDEISLYKGTKYNAIFNINAEIYQNISIDEEVNKVLSENNYRFNLNILDLNPDGTINYEGGLVKEITALLNKISNIKQITSLSISFTDSSGNKIEWDEILKENIELEQHGLVGSYFVTSYLINSIIYVNK
jgi:hypothetical protein